jgi:hypothetical protein
MVLLVCRRAWPTGRTSAATLAFAIVTLEERITAAATDAPAAIEPSPFRSVGRADHDPLREKKVS